jgi:hypothetical protein
MKNFLIITSLILIFCVAMYPPVKNPRLDSSEWSMDDWIRIIILSCGILVGVIFLGELIYE